MPGHRIRRARELRRSSPILSSRKTVTDAEAQELAAWLDDVRDDPVRFVEGAFEWGKGELENSTGPERWQRWLLEQIRDGLLKPGEAIKIAIASGHGIGKSAALSWLARWAITTFPGARGLVTASNEPMLMTRFRAELRIWFRRFKAREFFEMGATSLTSRDPEHAQTWRLDMVPWNENRLEGFAGLHSRGGRLFVAFDEASSMPGGLFDTTEAICTDALQAVWVVCGNPLHATGRFRDLFERFAHRWMTKRVNSLDVSFTNKLELRRWIEDWERILTSSGPEF
jgi:hypothetical protein